MRALLEGGALGREHLEHRQFDAVEAVDGPAVSPVRVHERGGVGVARGRNRVNRTSRRRRRAPTPHASAASATGIDGSRGRTHLGVLGRNRPWALALHGSSSASSASQSVAELVEESGALGGRGDAPHQLRAQLAGEELATGARVDHARAVAALVEAAARGVGVPRNHHDGTRTHVLLLAHHPLHLCLRYA